MGFEIQAQKKTIDGVEYQVTPLGAVTGRKALARLLKIAGPAIGKAKTGKDNEEAGGILLSELAERIAEDDLEYFCETFGNRTTYTQGHDARTGLPIQPTLTPANFDLHFAGRMGAMVNWLLFALEVNFSDFFQMLGLRKAKAPSDLAKDEKSP